MALTLGTIAPDFTLRSKTAAGVVDVTLSAHRGRQPVVLLFFPAVFSRVCTQEFCSLAGHDFFSSLDAAVYGISPDAYYAQFAWAEQNEISNPLLSDYRHEVTQMYDVVLPDLGGMGPSAHRAAFVIDLDGIIRYAEQCEHPGLLPDFDAIREVLQSLAVA